MKTTIPLLLGSLLVEGTLGSRRSQPTPTPPPEYESCMDAFHADQGFCKKTNSDYDFKKDVFKTNPCYPDPCTIEKCCAKRCDDTVCRHHWHLVLKDHPPLCHDTQCDKNGNLERCCVSTCSSIHAKCRHGMVEKPGETKCAGTKCTNDECCAPKCPHDICDHKDGLSRKRHPLPCMGPTCTEAECCDSMCTFGLDYAIVGVPGSSTDTEATGRQLVEVEEPKKAACCDIRCVNPDGKYQCGEANCEHLPGGPNKCCVHEINDKGDSCDDPHVHGAPCSIPSPCPKGICKKKGLMEKEHQPLVCDLRHDGRCTESECCDTYCHIEHPHLVVEGVLGTTDEGKTACCENTCVNSEGEYQCGGEGCAHFRIEGLWNKDSADKCCIGTIGDDGPRCSDQDSPNEQDSPTRGRSLASDESSPDESTTAPCFVPDKCTMDKCDKGSVLKWDMKNMPCTGIHCTSEECCYPAPTCKALFDEQPVDYFRVEDGELKFKRTKSAEDGLKEDGFELLTEAEFKEFKKLFAPAPTAPTVLAIPDPPTRVKVKVQQSPCGQDKVKAKDDTTCLGHDCTPHECCEDRVCPVTVPYHYEYLNIKDVQADCFDHAPKVLPQFVVGRIVGVTIPAEALVPTGHPASYESNGDGEYIKFKCESHFDKTDRLMSESMSEEGIMHAAEALGMNIVEGGGDESGGGTTTGGGHHMPRTGPPTSFCLSDGDEWKVGEDLHLIVYPDAGPFKISFDDEYNLCKDTIHFEADDPHCPIPECPTGMFSFDEDQVKVQTEYGFCDAHAAVKVTIDDQALSMIDCSYCMGQMQKEGSMTRSCNGCAMRMMKEMEACPSKESKSYVLEQDGYTTESLPLWDLEDGIHAHLFPNVSTTLTLIHESTPLKCREEFHFTPECVETPVCEANGIPGVQGKSEDGTACCALTCKNDDGELECGGEQCGLRDKEGGKSSCCIKEIIDHGPSCDERGATSPCSISGAHYPGPSPTEPHYPHPAPTKPHPPHPHPAPWPHPAPTKPQPPHPHSAPWPHPAPTKPHPPAPKNDYCDPHRFPYLEGIKGGNHRGDVCCPLKCTKNGCGGKKCGNWPGTRDDCCINVIHNKAPDCGPHQEAPCVLPKDHGPSPTPKPRPAPTPKPHPAPKPEPVKDVCASYDGLKGGNHRGDVCCPLKCKKNGCGGRTCGKNPHDRDDCCINMIHNKAPECGPHQNAPCVLGKSWW